MASQGPRFPTAAANLSNAGTAEDKDAWTTPSNVFSDNGTESTIIAATFDSPDIGQIMVVSGFGFNVSGAIDGVTVEIERRSIIAGSGEDFRVQLGNGLVFASLIGDNKADTALTWPSTATIKTYGSTSDDWNAGLTDAIVNSSNFAVFLSAAALIANADIGVDYIRVTIEFTPEDVKLRPRPMPQALAH